MLKELGWGARALDDGDAAASRSHVGRARGAAIGPRESLRKAAWLPSAVDPRARRRRSTYRPPASRAVARASLGHVPFPATLHTAEVRH